jgi:hypothetical protein
MPQLNTNEKRLLTVMGAAVFILANFFGWVLISGAMDGINAEEKKLKKRYADLDADKSKAAEAALKREWINKNVKTYRDEDARETHLNELLTHSLTDRLEIELSKNSPGKTVTTEFFVKSSYRTNAKGSWNDVMEFIYRLQEPSALRFVPHILMMPRKNELDDSEQYVEASLEIEQWWAKPDNAVADENTAADVEQPDAAGVNPPADTTQPAPDAATPPATPPADGVVPPATLAPAAPATPTESPKPAP